MRPIERLRPELVNQIAAGEVVERPASVLKELVENALDAGARAIEVRLEDGGRRLIRVQDDGHGIPAAELPLAVASHATSKLGSLDDLFRISTLGFRGEALASIGSVAELTVRSLARPPRGDGQGAAIEVRGGHEGPVRPAAASPGTVIEVRNLFFNTPARRKFLGGAPQETRQALLAATRLALGAPDVGFRVFADDRLAFETAPTTDPLRRIGDLFGHDLAADLLPIDQRRGLVRLCGWVGPPHRSRGDATQELVTLRALAPAGWSGADADLGGPSGAGRPIRDRLVTAALKEAYKGLLMTRRYPVAFLELGLPPDLVDVNVHPAKTEVRFRNPQEVFGLVVGAVRAALAREPTLPALAPSGAGLGAEAAGAGTAGAGAAGVATGAATMATGTVAAAAAAPSRGSYAAALHREAPRAFATSAPPSRPRFDVPPDYPAARALGLSSSPPAAGAQATPARPEPLLPAALPGAGARALLLGSGYLVVDAGDGFEVVDPHALHERILFERIQRRLAEGAVEVERLLIPIVLDLAPGDEAALAEAAPLLAPLGLRVEPFGPRAAAIHAVPLLLAPRRGRRGPDWGALVLDLVRVVEEGRSPERADLTAALAATMACKAAVKLGERLHPEEIDALLADRALAERSHLCPHGRPTALRFAARDLERQFKR